jgi:hypothetical protein
MIDISKTNLVSNLEINSDKITTGQGEYLIFHQSSNREKKELSRETFERVYKILVQYSPAALMNNESEKTTAEYANRYKLIKEKIKEIDPTLEAVFIPRTLYELIFIRKCIKEDLKAEEICPFLSPMLQTLMHTPTHPITKKTLIQLTEQDKKDFQTEQLKRKCWHLCYFRDAGDNEHAGVKDVAYRLNNVMVKAFDPLSEGFNHQELSTFAEKELEFLKIYHKKGLETQEQLIKNEMVKAIWSLDTPGPTTNFAFELSKGNIKPMGIRNEDDARIIRNAIDLECSKIAQHSLFLYRGADFQKDSPYEWNDKDTPYSLSYGSSLFAGCLYDGGATAFHHMRNGKNAYAIPIPFDQLNNSPFFIPATHTAAQLAGCGEIFHARTKAWKDFDVKAIGGVNIGGNSHIRDHLKSNLNREEFITQFEKYKSNAFQLK